MNEEMILLQIGHNIVKLPKTMAGCIFLGINVFVRNEDSLDRYYKKILFHNKGDHCLSLSKENYSEKEAERLHKESVNEFNNKFKENSN
jgi:hypothetical protein